MLHVIPIYPGSHPPRGHLPVIRSHGWLIQWQVSLHLYPYFPDPHAVKTSRNLLKNVEGDILEI